MSKIYMLMGKSASGKDCIYRKLLANRTLNLKPLVIYTTRPKRSGEIEGREYHFVDMKRLEAFRRDGLVIEERVYPTVFGDWYYFTADDGQVGKDNSSYLMIGTPVAFKAMRNYYGENAVGDIYIETPDGIRLTRALQREMHQDKPAYAEMCRRFLADEEDFGEDVLADACIKKRFSNGGSVEECLREVEKYIKRDVDVDVLEEN